MFWIPRFSGFSIKCSFYRYKLWSILCNPNETSAKGLFVAAAKSASLTNKLFIQKTATGLFEVMIFLIYEPNWKTCSRRRFKIGEVNSIIWVSSIIYYW